MLIGIDETGKKYNLTRFSREELKQLQLKQWCCPCCHTPLILKNGRVMRPHFAHKNLVACQAFSENESEEHLLGKQLIEKNCQKFHLPYEVEAYLPKLQQRPDILIQSNIAIEFQCSTLSIERLKERTDNYHRHGYQVIWLLGSPLYFKNKLTTLQKELINLSHNIGFYFWELEVKNKKIRNRYFIVNNQGRYYYQKKEWNLGKYSILDILQFPDKKTKGFSYIFSTSKQIQSKKEKWRQQLQRRQKEIMSVQEYFYQEGLTLPELPLHSLCPSFFSLQIGEQELMIRHVVMKHLLENRRTTYQEIFQEVKERLEGTVTLDSCLIEEKRWLAYHLSLYLCCLQQFGVIEKRENAYYYMTHQVDLSQRDQEILTIPLKYVMINK